MDIIAIIQEYNGVIKVYAVVDTRDYSTIASYHTIEEARERKEKENRKLYQWGGVLGNEVTI